MAVKKTINVTFDMDKETKTTVRFREQGDRTKFICGSIYVKKEHLSTIKDPKTINVTIEAA